MLKRSGDDTTLVALVLKSAEVSTRYSATAGSLSVQRALSCSLFFRTPSSSASTPDKKLPFGQWLQCILSLHHAHDRLWLREHQQTCTSYRPAVTAPASFPSTSHAQCSQPADAMTSLHVNTFLLRISQRKLWKRPAVQPLQSP